MRDISKSIIKWGAVISALGIIGGAALAFGDKTGFRPWLKMEQDAFTSKEFKLVMDSVEALTYANAASEFGRLEERLKRGDKLSWEEKRDFCTNAQILSYPVEGSYGLTCTKSGQPNLIVTE